MGESLGSPEVRLAVANLLTSEADKLISAFVALVVVSALPVAFRAGLGLLSAPEVAIGPVMGRSIR